MGGKSNLPTRLPARIPRSLSEWRIDRRSQPAREIAADLVAFCGDLGGAENLSAMERTLLERLVFLRRQMLEHESLVLAGKPGTMTPHEHVAASNAIQGLVKALGLKRRAKDAGDLRTYLAERAASSEPPVASSEAAT